MPPERTKTTYHHLADTLQPERTKTTYHHLAYTIALNKILSALPSDRVREKQTDILLLEILSDALHYNAQQIDIYPFLAPEEDQPNENIPSTDYLQAFCKRLSTKAPQNISVKLHKHFLLNLKNNTLTEPLTEEHVGAQTKRMEILNSMLSEIKHLQTKITQLEGNQQRNQNLEYIKKDLNTFKTDTNEDKTDLYERTQILENYRQQLLKIHKNLASQHFSWDKTKFSILLKLFSHIQQANKGAATRLVIVEKIAVLQILTNILQVCTRSSISPTPMNTTIETYQIALFSRKLSLAKHKKLMVTRNYPTLMPHAIIQTLASLEKTPSDTGTAERQKDIIECCRESTETYKKLESFRFQALNTPPQNSESPSEKTWGSSHIKHEFLFN